jgi:hypothetical protein
MVTSTEKKAPPVGQVRSKSAIAEALKVPRTAITHWAIAFDLPIYPMDSRNNADGIDEDGFRILETQAAKYKALNA